MVCGALMNGGASAIDAIISGSRELGLRKATAAPSRCVSARARIRVVEMKKKKIDIMYKIAVLFSLQCIIAKDVHCEFANAETRGFFYIYFLF